MSAVAGTSSAAPPTATHAPGNGDEPGCRAWPEGAAAQWAVIAEVFGARLVHDVREAIRPLPSGYEPGDYERGARAYFGWLICSPDDSVRRLVQAGYGNARRRKGARSDAAVLLAVNACFSRFCDGLAAFGSISGSTVWTRQRCAAHVLEGLGKLDGGRYPAFLIALHSRHRAIGETPMLGSLPIANGIAAPPGVLRERQALDRVRALSLEEFRDHVVMVEAATPIRLNAALCCGENAALDSVHRALAQAWSILPARSGDRVRRASDLVSEAPDMVTDPASWIAAGIPEKCVRRFSKSGARMHRATVGQLALACLGPSQTMVTAGAAVVASARGWNKGSIRAISADPFIFAIEGKFGLAGGSFVTALKNRAGHAVAMFLNGSQGADEALLRELVEEWRALAAAAGADLLGDQMLVGIEPDDAPGAAVLEVIDGLKRLSKPLRQHDASYGSDDRLFTFPLLNECSERHVLNILTLSVSTTPALATVGATLPSIRSSWAFVEHDRRRSLAATMAACGQVAPMVTMRNYLNRAEVGEELRKALRFFQAICQTLIVGNEVIALRIGVAESDFNRLNRLARASGMAAAFGLDVPNVRPAAVLRFTPSEANLRDLFLALWALRVAARTLPSATWRARCLELFAAARAIAAALRAAGLAKDYAAAARAAYDDCRAGLVSLPSVEGVRR